MTTAAVYLGCESINGTYFNKSPYGLEATCPYAEQRHRSDSRWPPRGCKSESLLDSCGIKEREIEQP